MCSGAARVVTPNLVLARCYSWRGAVVAARCGQRAIRGRRLRLVVLRLFNNHCGYATDGGSNHSTFGVILGDGGSDGGGDCRTGSHNGSASGGKSLLGTPLLGWKIVDLVQLFNPIHGLIHGAHDSIDVHVIFLWRRRIGRRILLLRRILLRLRRILGRILRWILLRVRRLRRLLRRLLVLVLVLRLRLGQRQACSRESKDEGQSGLHNSVFHLSAVDAAGGNGFRKRRIKIH